jgi:2,3-bisphosphoglycerate-dependent phosphoglycerate mutase
MIRSIETGLPLAQALNLSLVAWKDLHETGGIFYIDEKQEECIGLPGKARSYFAEHYPGLRLPDDLGEDGWWNRSFETREERPQRAQRVFDELLARHGGTEDRVALIGHAGFYNHLLRAILELPDPNDHWFFKNNVAITRVDFRAESTNVVYTNRLDFLPSEMIT